MEPDRSGAIFLFAKSV